MTFNFLKISILIILSCQINILRSSLEKTDVTWIHWYRHERSYVSFSLNDVSLFSTKIEYSHHILKKFLIHIEKFFLIFSASNLAVIAISAKLTSSIFSYEPKIIIEIIFLTFMLSIFQLLDEWSNLRQNNRTSYLIQLDTRLFFRLNRITRF